MKSADIYRKEVEVGEPVDAAVQVPEVMPSECVVTEGVMLLAGELSSVLMRSPEAIRDY
jgi:hypothetical protein